jgi:hypothetical protein
MATQGGTILTSEEAEKARTPLPASVKADLGISKLIFSYYP